MTEIEQMLGKLILQELPQPAVQGKLEYLFGLALELWKTQPEAKIDSELFKELWNLSGQEQSTKFLIGHLHKLHLHPECEYQSITYGRKQEHDRLPEGKGWVPNTYYDRSGQYYNDFDRGEFDEVQWYRRLKSQALFDTIDPFDPGRKIHYESINLLRVLKLLLVCVTEASFPMPALPSKEEVIFGQDMIDVFLKDVATIKRAKYNPAPNVVERRRFVSQLKLGVNIYTGTEWLPGENNIICTISKNLGILADPNTKYYYIHTKELDILVNLNKPFSESFVRVNYKAVSERAGFVQWPHFANICVNYFEIEKIANTIRYYHLERSTS